MDDNDKCRTEVKKKKAATPTETLMMMMMMMLVRCLNKVTARWSHFSSLFSLLLHCAEEKERKKKEKMMMMNKKVKRWRRRRRRRKNKKRGTMPGMKLPRCKSLALVRKVSNMFLLPPPLLLFTNVYEVCVSLGWKGDSDVPPPTPPPVISNRARGMRKPCKIFCDHASALISRVPFFPHSYFVVRSNAFFTPV